MAFFSRIFFFRFWPFILLVLSFIGLKLLSPKGVRDRFSLTNIRSTMIHSPKWDIPMRKEDREECLFALQQPFYYLSTGTECHVFVSMDDRYVLKFFRHRRWRLPVFVQSIPLPRFLEDKRAAYLERKRGAVLKTFQSCITAYRHFREDTGVLYLHLFPTEHLQIKGRVTDRMGITYTIPFDEIDFLLQRKAIRTDEYLHNLRKLGAHKKAKEAITAMLNFTIKRAQKGYNDTDPHFISNFGFIGEKAIQIDVGSFYTHIERGLPYFYSHEIKRIKRKCLPWIKRHYPELTSYVEKEIERAYEDAKSN